MASAQTLADLAVQKRLLVAESEANRLALAAELQRATAPLRWLEQLGSRTRPLLLLGAPIAGFLATRRLPKVIRLLSRGFRVLRVFRVFKGLKGLVRKRSS